MKTSSNQHPIFLAGWDGFIRRHLTAALKNRFPNVEISGFGARDMDPILDNSWKSLASFMDSVLRGETGIIHFGTEKSLSYFDFAIIHFPDHRHLIIESGVFRTTTNSICNNPLTMYEQGVLE